MFEIFGIPSTALYGQLTARADQRRVLCAADPRPRRDLRPAQHHQLHAMARCTCSAPSPPGLLLQLCGARLLAGADARADHRSASLGMVIERLLSCAWLYKLDHLYGLLLTFGLALIIEGAVAQPLRLLRPALHAAGFAARRATNLGFMFLPNYRAWVIVAVARGVPRHLVRDREDAARRLSARGDRESAAGAGLRRQRAAHGHADLRRRRRAGGVRRRAGGADLLRSIRTWART